MTNLYNLAAAFVVTFGSFTYGFSSSIVAGIIGLPNFLSYFDLTSDNAEYANSIIGAMNGVYSAGGVIGCLAIGWPADRFGRKWSIFGVGLLGIVSAVITAASVNAGMLLCGRTLQGVSAGMLNSICPTYQSEIAPSDRRGRMVGGHAVMLVAGIASANWVALGCYFITSPQLQWRLAFALQALPALLLVFGCFFIPESPRWLIHRGRLEQARETLGKLRSRRDDDSSAGADEFVLISKQIQLDRKNEMGWLQLFRTPSTRKRLFVGFVVIATAQATGHTVINKYQVSLYNNLGITGWMPLMLLSVYTSWASFMNWIGALLLDRFGRRKVLFIGVIGAALSNACESAMIAVYSGTTNRIGNGFGVAFLFCFITFFAGGIDATCYVYTTEIFPTWMRAQGVAFSISALFAMTVLYTSVAPIAFAAITWRFFLVFVFPPLAGCFLLFRIMPETHRQSLEAIGAIFGDEVVAEAVIEMDPEADKKEAVQSRVVEISETSDYLVGKEQAGPTA